MMASSESTSGLLLNGLDGSNPLGFLAAIGTAVTLHGSFPGIRFGWEATASGWRPLITGCGDDEEEFSSNLSSALQNAPMTVFDIDDKMPFGAAKFSDALRDVQHRASISNRRAADFLASFGTELYPRKGQFQDSKFRMVRSGDSAGQGLPFYAKAIRKEADLECIRRAVFRIWDYQDEGYSLRWDPVEDQRYALRWRDPSKSDLANGPGNMRAANCLAIEALQWFPTLWTTGNRVQTTSFQRLGRRETFFVWPIWTPMVGMETVRSLLALDDLYKNPVPRSSLAKRGIEEVYRSQRIQQNQYYSNFTIAVPA
jgi:hypothetical protein